MTVNETKEAYSALEVESGWIDYLRTRLPYSFRRIEGKGRGYDRHFVLSEPVWLSDSGMAAKYHNFWRRGNISYMAGRLLDFFPLSSIMQGYGTLEELRRLSGEASSRFLWPTNPFDFYNSMQVEKVWRFAQENHLDRERVAMLNVTQAVELCLKAVMTHANYRERRAFRFDAGHDLTTLFAGLPTSLQDEIKLESSVFAREYLEFRTRTESDFKRLRTRPVGGPVDPAEMQQRVNEWDRMAKRIGESSYTAFVNSNDPGATAKYLHTDWLEEAMKRIKQEEELGGISEYFRYAPLAEQDELPVDLIHWMLVLGRFMYEHLFPVPPSNTTRLRTFL